MSEQLIRVTEHAAVLFDEKQKLASELFIAYKSLSFEIEEKGKRAAELAIANLELTYQNKEKERRAAELILANKELLFQKREKEKRAEELVIANKELVYQNIEKEKRAAELVIANKELLFQNIEKEKRAEELVVANKELERFVYVASHDLQEPLRTISNYMIVFEEEYMSLLDDKARKYLISVNNAIKRMSLLIKSLLGFSRLGQNKKLIYIDSKIIIDNVIADLETLIKSSHAVINLGEMPVLNVYETELYQLFQNLITNAIKFCKKNEYPEIQISSEKINTEWRFSIKDKGIGINPIHFSKLFELFQRLDTASEGCGIGLANCKKIIQLHKGKIWIESSLNQGTTFHFTIPI